MVPPTKVITKITQSRQISQQEELYQGSDAISS